MNKYGVDQNKETQALAQMGDQIYGASRRLDAEDREKLDKTVDAIMHQCDMAGQTALSAMLIALSNIAMSEEA